jgi:alpha-1,3-glucan synthase
MRFSHLLGLAPFIASALAAPYNATYAEYNLNTNQNAQSPLDYDTSFVPSQYTPSPDNWRFPYYTILMDKFADGDPTNNDYFGTEFEWDWRETNFRYGGDLAGLESKLDYLAGMGIKAIYASGTPWINMIWQADSASTPFFLLFNSRSHVLCPPFFFSITLIVADCVAVS